jgi:hypothetical protein
MAVVACQCPILEAAKLGTANSAEGSGMVMELWIEDALPEIPDEIENEVLSTNDVLEEDDLVGIVLSEDIHLDEMDEPEVVSPYSLEDLGYPLCFASQNRWLENLCCSGVEGMFLDLDGVTWFEDVKARLELERARMEEEIADW